MQITMVGRWGKKLKINVYMHVFFHAKGPHSFYCYSLQEQQEEWVKKLKFHATLAPSKQLTSYSSVTETVGEAEPVYANLPSPPPTATTTTNNVSPPRVTSLTASGERPEGFGVAGTRDLLNKKAGSREPIAGENFSNLNILLLLPL